ncbi:MAG: T9SS type A sorting domain-containing protein, partial [Bacteroidia bacterium]|nr:T9SS type A sorting domain-containing protein [Bacteroidia bacterium]
PSASTDVIITTTTSNQPNLNTNIQLNSLWIKSSNTLNINNNQNLSILYDIVNCGVLTGNGVNSLLQLNGTSASTPTQYLSGTGTYSLNDLTINNTHTLSQSIVLNAPLYLTNDLTLTSGIVSTTSANILALETNATSTSGSASSYISGPMSKAGTAAFTFPVGKGGRWRRIGISAPSSSSTFRAEYFNTAYTNTSSVNAPITDVSKIEYWQLDRTVGTGNASVSLYWESATASGIDNCADLTIVRFNGTGWDERAATTTTSSTCSGTGTGVVTTTAVVTAFSPFTFGSKSTGVNPLPIELIDFDASCESGSTVFKWTTASEYHNDYFSIEYSESGNEWKEIARIKSKGNSSTYKDYIWPIDGALNGYYRLVQVDIDKSREAFKVVDLNCFNIQSNTYNLFPNPTTGEFTLDFSLMNSYPDASIDIVNILGKSVWQKNLNLVKGYSNVKVNPELQSGVYYIRILSGQLDLPVVKLVIK